MKLAKPFIQVSAECREGAERLDKEEIDSRVSDAAELLEA